jgi:hypothetical protein
MARDVAYTAHRPDATHQPLGLVARQRPDERDAAVGDLNVDVPVVDGVAHRRADALRSAIRPRARLAASQAVSATRAVARRSWWVATSRTSVRRRCPRAGSSRYMPAAPSAAARIALPLIGASSRVWFACRPG